MSARRSTALMIVILISMVATVGACDGSSAKKSAAPSQSTSASIASTSKTPLTGGTRLQVAAWGRTSDGLLSVLVHNTGTTTVRAAHAIITAKDKFGNSVAVASAPTGARCCTVIGLAPGHEYGLYADIGPRVSRVQTVSVQYTGIRTSAGSMATPVVSMHHASLAVDGDHADVSVTIVMSGTVGPYITAQALLDGPNGKFLGVISGGYFCIPPGTQRTIRLQLFHPVPKGTSVSKLIALPLDPVFARAEKLPRCTKG